MLINLEFNSIAELDEFVAHYGKSKGAVQNVTTAPKNTAPKDELPKDPPAPKVPVAPKETKTTAAPKDTTEGELSYAKDIAPRVLKLAEAKGRDAAVAILSQFDVTKAPQLTAEQYPAFIKAVDAKMAED